ncbi:hypothetical protein [Chryseobacterium pennipullorum]|uniref:Uncharacterized protein n=1 Tax=Chryseobacterium pennipullorum TaxID=2258963 RepID=A0A3D9AZE4_9FLAO|nr:hypothetical protein [Chryseobacterium pennipullorum]REC46639.1 hypothetical protein DRF67_13940 [Chryseobacterium pennipullorum]
MGNYLDLRILVIKNIMYGGYFFWCKDFISVDFTLFFHQLYSTVLSLSLFKTIICHHIFAAENLD